MKLTTLWLASCAVVAACTLPACQHLPTSSASANMPEITAPTGTAQRLWRHNTLSGVNQYVNLVPSADAQALYAADHKGRIIALNKVTGQTLWQQRIEHPISAGPHIVGEYLMTGTSTGQVFAHHKANGDLVWQAQMPSEVLAAPNGDQQMILVNTVDGKLTALDYKTGALRWVHDHTPPALILRRSAMPQLSHAAVLAGFSNGKFASLHKDSGVVQWETRIAEPRGRSELHRMVDIAINPLVDENHVYVASVKGRLSALSLQSGEARWTLDIPVSHNMSAQKDVLYVTDEAHHLYAIAKQTGAILWRQDKLAEHDLLSPVVDGKWLYVTDSKGHLYWLDSASGQLAGHYDLKHTLLSDFIISDNKLYLQGKNGTLTAIQVSSATS